ncbi:hypothetical protein V6N12_018897 [Hibiscus sabdariffa]|uniref:Uncharacterized protein n=1 Tax=Hibiscus sabdariffa TaxID=183260 RepID=A0ABR2ATN1_9ROSI
MFCKPRDVHHGTTLQKLAYVASSGEHTGFFSKRRKNSSLCAHHTAPDHSVITFEIGGKSQGPIRSASSDIFCKLRGEISSNHSFTSKLKLRSYLLFQYINGNLTLATEITPSHLKEDKRGLYVQVSLLQSLSILILYKHCSPLLPYVGFKLLSEYNRVLKYEQINKLGKMLEFSQDKQNTKKRKHHFIARKWKVAEEWKTLRRKQERLL